MLRRSKYGRFQFLRRTQYIAGARTGLRMWRHVQLSRPLYVPCILLHGIQTDLSMEPIFNGAPHLELLKWLWACSYHIKHITALLFTASTAVVNTVQLLLHLKILLTEMVMSMFIPHQGPYRSAFTAVGQGVYKPLHRVNLSLTLVYQRHLWRGEMKVP